MKLKFGTSLFTAMIAFSPAAIAQSPPSPMTPPPTSPPKEQPSTSNKGGQLRGLDRADRAAGEHGQQGRETARDAQLNRPDPSERSGLPDHLGRPDRPGR
jgi:hypothetical protein